MYFAICKLLKVTMKRKLLKFFLGMHRNFSWRNLKKKKKRYMSQIYMAHCPSVFSTQVSLSHSIFLQFCEWQRFRRCTTKSHEVTLAKQVSQFALLDVPLPAQLFMAQKNVPLVYCSRSLEKSAQIMCQHEISL